MFEDRLRLAGVFDPSQQNSSVSSQPMDPTAGINAAMMGGQRLHYADSETMNNRGIRAVGLQQQGAYQAGRLQDTFGAGGQDTSRMNTVFNPGMTPYQSGELALGKEKLDESKSSGDEAQALKDKQFDLETKKNQQIYQTKMDDMQRKADEADKKLALAQSDMERKKGDATALQAFHEAQIAATNARHDLDLAQKDKELKESQRLHDEQIKKMQGDLDLAKTPKKTTTTVNDAGNERTTVTGPQGPTIRVIAPDGTHGSFPANEPLPNGYQKIQ